MMNEEFTGHMLCYQIKISFMLTNTSGHRTTSESHGQMSAIKHIEKLLHNLYINLL